MVNGEALGSLEGGHEPALAGRPLAAPARAGAKLCHEVAGKFLEFKSPFKINE